MAVPGQLYGCVEAGGTKFVVGIVAADRTIIDSQRVATTTPAETIPATIDWLRAAQARHGAVTAIGIASFGPVELERASAEWGHITATTKPGWSDTPFGSVLAEVFGVPVGFDTDVNGAALAELRWGAAQGVKSAVYVTVGTGIGGGAVVDGRVVHGLGHAEMGHFRVPRHLRDTRFAGICPFHGDCLEGLASGPAIIARWGGSLSDLGPEHEAQDVVAHYLGQMAMTLQAVLAPEKIIFGGGVMAAAGMVERVRAECAKQAKGYFRGSIDDIIVSPGLGDRAGLLGGLALALDAADARLPRPVDAAMVRDDSGPDRRP